MHSDVNLESAVGALGFVGACLLLGALALVLAHAEARACVFNALERFVFRGVVYEVSSMRGPRRGLA